MFNFNLEIYNSGRADLKIDGEKKKINRKSQSHLAAIQPTDEMSNVELVVWTAIEHVFWLKNSKVITLICKKSLTLKETALP